jgi:nitroreductase
MDRTSDPLDVAEAIFTTGAQRRLKPDPIPGWTIWAVLDAAIRGPSGGNGQRWAWVVVTDDEVKRQIAAWYLEAWNALSMGRRARLRRAVKQVVGRRGEVSEMEPGAPSPPVASTGPDDRNYRSGEHLAKNIASAPVWIFAVVTGIKGEPSVVDGADIYGAVQNLMLAARKYGLGTTLTMLHRQHEKEVAATLGLPRDARALALIPMGYPESGRFFTSRRHPVETVTHWEQWGERRTRPPLEGAVPAVTTAHSGQLNGAG